MARETEEAIDLFMMVWNTAISAKDLAHELSMSTGTDWSGLSKAKMAKRLACGPVNLHDRKRWIQELHARRGVKPGVILR